MHILNLPTDIFNVYPASVKFKTYQARWQIGDIYVSGDARKTEDNPQGLGCYLVMTGRGCDDIFRILDSRNYTFGDMFRRCERRYGLDNFHFTRLDIAIDDKNEKPFFTIEQIKKKCEKEEFISISGSPPGGASIVSECMMLRSAGREKTRRSNLPLTD